MTRTPSRKQHTIMVHTSSPFVSQRETKKFLSKLGRQDLKKKVIQAVSQQRGEGNQEFLLDIALDEDEAFDIRKNALFWAGQSRQVPIEALTRLYDTMPDREMREQLIFVYSQRRSSEAVDKLMDIARTDDDRELRKKAIFWLGQSRDPRVVEFLLELIERADP